MKYYILLLSFFIFLVITTITFAYHNLIFVITLLIIVSLLLLSISLFFIKIIKNKKIKTTTIPPIILPIKKDTPPIESLTPLLLPTVITNGLENNYFSNDNLENKKSEVSTQLLLPQNTPIQEASSLNVKPNISTINKIQELTPLLLPGIITTLTEKNPNNRKITLPKSPVISGNTNPKSTIQNTITSSHSKTKKTLSTLINKQSPRHHKQYSTKYNNIINIIHSS